MIKQTNVIAIGALFKDNSRSYKYEIPKYQREYTWGIHEWNALFNDILTNDNGYFLGSIICVDLSKGARGTAIFEVIDGQQRITTLSLLLLSLYGKLAPYFKELSSIDIREVTQFGNLKEQLVFENEDYEIEARLKPQSQNFNKEDYLSLLCEKGLLFDQTEKKYASLRRIYKAYNYFSDVIDNYLNEVKEQKETSGLLFNHKKELFKLVDKFNSAVLVSIEVDTHKDAYMLFESLNNRGIPLTAIELIKNMIIRKSDEVKKADAAYSQWKKIINTYLGDEYSVQERFFRQYYNAFRDELNAPFPSDGKTKYYLGLLATKSSLLDIYEKLLEKDYVKLLNDLELKAKQYSIIINNSSDDTVSSDIKESLMNLERIQGAPSYLLLLYLFSYKERFELSDDIINEIIVYLTKFFVRRNITDYPNTRNLNKIFMEIIDLISNAKGEEVKTIILSHLKENSSKDDKFEEKLRGPLYTLNVDSTRFILCYYEEKNKTKEIHTDLWKRDKYKKYIWTIEHIFPEGDNIPPHWVDMIADGDQKKAVEYLNTYVHTLGNLTITGYNQNLSNMSFEAKMNRKKDDKFIGYRNGLKLNEDIVTKTAWTVEDIKNRTDKLVSDLLKEFQL